ncbi:hypothetical protein PVL29_006165 [Vitis rotundifolia]|uniref:Methyltransferase n=1 Tax=Vitis rotundifolia TaxID=103349 RepID=A0AA39A6D9_VITRO|nr:hypothetical protein PVL29_006165 [Vitis rotundifolia]
MRGRADGSQRRRLLTSLCVVAVFLVFLYVYHGSIFGSQKALEYGSRSLRKLGLTGDEDADLGSKLDESSSKFGQEDGEDVVIPKSFPVCDDRHSELIPCLDRNLIYQMRLKHCPLPERRYNCLIPPPAGYKVPIKWPKSRDEVWKANIPHTHLAHEKSDQNWMVVKGEKIVFPGGGTHFHYGADKYIASLANMLNFSNNNLNNEGRIRTVFDVGCGVASFGAYLLSSDIITMSLAPNECIRTRSNLPWREEFLHILNMGEMSALVERMCWRIAAKRNQTVIWQKPVTNDCYMERAPGTQPPLCRSDDDPDAVWGVQMEACITPYSDRSELAPWPARSTAPPPRLADFGYSKDIFEKDTEVWMQRVESYWNLLSPKITSDTCEAFSTYPRTYDLLHAWTVFSEIEKKGCSAEDLLIEMDRILRPTGFVIIRDKPSVIEFVKKYLTALHWEAVSNERDGDELVFLIQKKMWLTSESLRDTE